MAGAECKRSGIAFIVALFLRCRIRLIILRRVLFQSPKMDFDNALTGLVSIQLFELYTEFNSLCKRDISFSNFSRPDNTRLQNNNILRFYIIMDL